MKKLIVNADDFGLHPSVNQAIIKGYTEGIITSTSIMPTGKFFHEAVNLGLNTPNLGIGIHLTLVAEKPCLPIASIKSLVDNEEKFYANYIDFIKKYFMGKIVKDEVYKELEAQIKIVRETGLSITHIDSHQHLHVLPGVIDIVIALAQKYSIGAIRIPAEKYLFCGGYHAGAKRIVGKYGLTYLANCAKTKVKKYGLKTPDYFFGMLAGGNMSKLYLDNMIKALPIGVSEIMIHPGLDSTILQKEFGWNYHWENELQATLHQDTKQLIHECGITLSSFGAL